MWPGLAIALGVLALFAAVLMLASMHGRAERARGRAEQQAREIEDAEKIRERIAEIESRHLSRDKLLVALRRLLDRRRRSEDE